MNIDLPEILRHVIMSSLRRPSGQIRPVTGKTGLGKILFFTILLKEEMDEDLKRAIEDLHVVSSVSFHVGDKTHKGGVYANLRCSAASSHGECGAKLVGPIRMSTKFPTLRDCLRELG